ncbi:GFA family protein [Patescibacteria group bacterium]|nr:GFA family protein [Patescibacteria group bacterium]
MPLHTGSCHCQNVRYEVDIDLTQPVIECNCSYCEPKGFLLSFVPAASFSAQGEENLTEYRFNTEKLQHLFCKTCGVQPFCRGEGKAGPTVAVNVRTIDGIELGNLTRLPFDGRSA